MTHIFIRVVAVIILILFLFNSCIIFDDDQETFNPQTIEDVIASRDFYFTFYLNGELWYTRPRDPLFLYNLPKHQTSFDFNKSYSHEDTIPFKITAYRYPDRDTKEQKDVKGDQSFEIDFRGWWWGSTSIILDTVPFILLESSFEDQQPYIYFWDGLHIGYGTNPLSGVGRYDNIVDIMLSIDKIENYDSNWNQDSLGLNNVVYGRLNGTFINDYEDTVYITKGQFKLKEGLWTNPKNI